MMRRSADARRRSSTLAPKRVSESAVKSSLAAPSRVAPGSTVKSRLPRPSLAAQRAGHSVGKRGQRSAAGAPTSSRLTVGPRLSAVTPQTSRRLVGVATASKAMPSRLSSDSARRLSRDSGIGASRGRCPDPRPISDKAFWQAATHRLVQFLNDRTRFGKVFNEGRPPLTYKKLISCTGRDFDDIFTFLYGFFSPNFTMDGKKREEEVPAVMKMLGYTGLITKSHLITIGCAHSWPPVIATLSWLADQVDLVFGSDLLVAMLPTIDNDGFPEVDQEQYVQLENAMDTYSRWLSGQDINAEEEAQRLAEKAAAALQTVDEAEMRRLELENEHLRQEMPDLRRLEEQLQELEQRRMALETDGRRLAEYVENKREQQAERTRQLEWLQQQREHRASLQKMMEDQVEALKQELSQQEMSAEDVAKIDQQRAALQKQIDACREEVAQVTSRNDALEIELGRAQAQCEAAARHLNGQLSELAGRLPAAAGLELRLRGGPADQLRQLADVERAAEAAERAARHELERLMTARLQQEKAARELRDSLEKERQHRFHAEARLRRLEEGDAADRAQLEARHAELDAALNEVEDKVARVTQEIQQLNVVSERSEYEAAVRQLAEDTAAHERQLKDRMREVAEAAAMALDFRSRVEDDFEELARKVAAMTDEAAETMRATLRRHQASQEPAERVPLASRREDAENRAAAGGCQARQAVLDDVKPVQEREAPAQEQKAAQEQEAPAQEQEAAQQQGKAAQELETPVSGDEENQPPADAGTPALTAGGQ